MSKVLRLTASNIKRLIAVEITPEGNLVRIEGRNGQGKSSVLDSIIYALGGKKFLPSEPIRKGETEGKIDIDLGDIIVTRRFSRDRLECDCGENAGIDFGKPDLKHKAKCASHKFGETRSTVMVRSNENLQYPSPQAVLDKLLGTLTFDPLEFVNAKSDKQVEILKSVVNLDTSEMDEERAVLYSQRTLLNKQLSSGVVFLENMPAATKDGLDYVSIEAVIADLGNAEELRKGVEQERERLAIIQTEMDKGQTLAEQLRKEIEGLERTLKAAKEKLAKTEAGIAQASAGFDTLFATHQKRKASIPDTAAIKEKLSALEATNARIEGNRKRKAQEEAVAKLRKDVQAKTETMEEIDTAKRKMIEAIEFPVDGLGFDEDKDEVTFGEVPFNQASKAEQIRVSVAIGLALNPKLKVLLIKDGSALDKEGMRLLAELAEQADAQLWVERVAETEDGVGVVIEDGAVV
jgi:DNA repair exonuclease SbcCD ATPase subunit